MKAIKFLLLLTIMSPMGISQALAYDDKANEFQTGDPAQASLPSADGGKGLLATSEFAIGTILASHHFNTDEDYNETHNGIYLSFNEWSVGSYKNSESKQSTFVTYNAEIYQDRIVEVDFVVGVADNYDGWKMSQGEYLPIVGFSAKWSYVKTMLSYDVVAFGFELPLN